MLNAGSLLSAAFAQRQVDSGLTLWVCWRADGEVCTADVVNNVNVHVTQLTQQSTGRKGRSVVVWWKKDVSVGQDAVAFQFVLLFVIRELTSQIHVAAPLTVAAAGVMQQRRVGLGRLKLCDCVMFGRLQRWRWLLLLHIYIPVTFLCRVTLCDGAWRATIPIWKSN